MTTPKIQWHDLHTCVNWTHCSPQFFPTWPPTLSPLRVWSALALPRILLLGRISWLFQAERPRNCTLTYLQVTGTHMKVVLEHHWWASCTSLMRNCTHQWGISEYSFQVANFSMLFVLGWTQTNISRLFLWHF